MVNEIKTQTVVRSKKKKVKEEIVRLQTDGAISANDEEVMYPFGGSTGQPSWAIPIGEAAELISAGVHTVDNMEYARFIDSNQQQWNKFLTQNTVGNNALPIHNLAHFEKLMMSWGYGSFLSKKAREVRNIAPTLKESEGDEINLYVGAGSGAVTSANYAIMTVRRFLQGSNVDYKHFHENDGGFGSNRFFYNLYNKLATTVAGQWTDGWEQKLEKNEGYKFFTGGVIPVSNLVQARIMIDDPEITYNSYFVHTDYNVLPYVDTYALDTGYDPTATASVTRTGLINKMHRFIPTIDVVKNRNKNLKVQLKDSGTEATNVYHRLVGVKYAL